MKLFSLFFIWFALALSATTHAQTKPAATGGGKCPAVLDYTVERLQDEKPQNLCQYAGQVVLVVNTASFCGFTPAIQKPGRTLRTLQRQRFGGVGFSVQ